MDEAGHAQAPAGELTRLEMPGIAKARTTRINPRHRPCRARRLTSEDQLLPISRYIGVGAAESSPVCQAFGFLDGDITSMESQSTGRLLYRVSVMPRPELVLVARFEIPAESVLSRRPEHKVWRDFNSN
jgi:hypothetical protein